MRRLAPTPVELGTVYAGLTLPEGRDRRGTESRHALPWVALGMVASADGAAALAGRTQELGGEADSIAFRRLRAACDAILVGAGTVRDEAYGPPGGTAERRADRVARGLTPHPRLVVVSGSLAIDPDHRVFSDPEQRPLLITHHGAPADRVESLSRVADVVRVGERAVDLRAALAHLGELGLARVLCEGGPTLNAALAAEDLIDELFVTVAPLLAAGTAPRIVSGAADAAIPLELIDLHEHDGELLLRYRRAR